MLKNTLILLLLFTVNAVAQSGKWQQLGGSVSTQGVSISYELKLRDSSRFSYKAYGSYIGYQKVQEVSFDEGSVLNIDPEIRKIQLGAKAYFYPFKKRKWFSLAGGVGIDVAQKYDLQITTETGFNSDGLIINADDFGIIETGINWQRVMPSLGIRFGSSPTNHKFTVSGELGVLYMGSPKLRVNYEGFLETTTLDQEIIKIQRNMRGYSYYPLLELSFGYRL
jgi:hypothetical protein